ncbi:MULTISPECIES: integrase [unclassified Archaeoglobus]|uniref:integrase n=1 Tax=unclassified Archaeoglobus TaxID=2643606 RepID=UPI0025BD9BF0|nr:MULTISPECIES: integrase [unclassified Archaeoglobus]
MRQLKEEGEQSFDDITRLQQISNKNMISIKEIYSQFREEFKNWLMSRVRQEKLTEKTAMDYMSVLDRNEDKLEVYLPFDLENIEIKKGLALALRNFLNFLEDRDVEKINGYSIDKWRKKIVIPTAKAQEIYITNKELQEAYENLRGKKPIYRTIFKMLVFSGARLKHVYDALKSFDLEKVVIVDNIARYPITHLTKGAKKGYWLYFPAEFVEELKKAKVNQGYKSIQKGLMHGRVNAETIRKWHFNFMIIENDVPESVADFIQERRPATVGSAHYLNKIKSADKEYKKIVDKFPILS